MRQQGGMAARQPNAAERPQQQRQQQQQQAAQQRPRPNIFPAGMAWLRCNVCIDSVLGRGHAHCNKVRGSLITVCEHPPELSFMAMPGAWDG